MTYILKKNLANRANYGWKRNVKDIKYIVIHFTANDGDHDEGNANYFVDDDSITQSLGDNYVAWSVGGGKYSSCAYTGGGKFYGKCSNANSLNMELCDTVRNGKSGFTKETVTNAVNLVISLMEKYDIDLNHVIRHFDVTGKLCPKPFVDNAKGWKEFKKRLVKKYFRAKKKISLRSTPKIAGKRIVFIPDGKMVRVLEKTTDKYWKVKLTLGGTVYKGYCNKRYLK